MSMELACFRGIRAYLAIIVLSGLLFTVPAVRAQDNVGDDSTVLYPASYFYEYQPVTALDMVNRIPGMNIRNNNGASAGNASRGGRGLGGGRGGVEILINGKRTAGKNNNTQGQLTRIAADQVEAIEIIRGTGGDLDVRGSTQIANIVLLEQQSNRSVSYAINANQYHDDHVEPGGSLSYSDTVGDLNFLVNASAEPQYQNQRSQEHSILGDLSANDFIKEERVRDQTNYTLSTNLDYQFSTSTSMRFNALYAENDNPTTLDRLTVDLRDNAFDHYYQREDTPGEQSNWEIGGDIEHLLENGARFKALFISNENDTASKRERWDVFTDGSESKNLFLDSSNVITEKIFRTSYTTDLMPNHNLEVGVEAAQTILDSDLRLAVRSDSGMPSAEYGGLVPVDVPNSNTEVEEMRYEPFAIHNWRINPRMSLESSLVYESSEIEQSGDFSQSRKFTFFKPKVDYRFDITPQLQFRFLVERMVRQINFVDFVATTDTEDEDSNTLAGNRNLRPDYWWNYNALLEYRLPDDVGVVSANLYQHRHKDFRQRIDVSTSEDNLESAVGNIGNGDMWVFELNGSVRMKWINMPNLLVTSRFSIRDSEVYDPLLGDLRSFNNYHRGEFGLQIRHDIPRWRLNYGFSYLDRRDSDFKQWDIDKIDTLPTEPFSRAFVEWIGFNELTFRFDLWNALNPDQCRERERYAGRISAGILSELEQRCSTTGQRLTFSVSGNF